MTATKIEQLRTMTYEVAEAVAPTWEKRRGFIEDVARPVREWMIEALAPKPGETVLELAAGVGDTGFEVAETLGADGRLISTDFSPKMVEAAKRRGAELGIENVEYEVIDAEAIDLEADSVDAVICRFGYMLMADRNRALAETRRVLRPGGRVTLSVWGPPDRNPCFMALGMELVGRGHMPPPDPQGPGLFSLASPDGLQVALEGAGFTDARVEEIGVRFRAASAEEYVAIMADTAGPLAMALRGVPDDECAEIVEKLEQAYAPFAANGGYEVPGLALVAVAS